MGILVSPDMGQKQIAMKCLRAGSRKSNIEFFTEVAILKKIKHPNIVQLIGICSMNEPYMIVFELEDNHDLLKYLRSPDRTIELEDKLTICYQVHKLS